MPGYFQRAATLPIVCALLFVASAYIVLDGKFYSVSVDESAQKPTKRIAIVGMGVAGVASLKGLMSLPEHDRKGWEVVAFEQREAVGGLWLPQPDPPAPPEIPETPLYPDLRINNPHSFQTFPHLPFRPELPLIVSHDEVLRYHQDIITNFGLSPYIRLRHAVHRAAWVGDSTSGHWDLEVEDLERFHVSHQQFEHLIVASGVNRAPHYPQFVGQDDWRAAGKTIMHAIYFRHRSAFAGRKVIVVGGGPTGWDIVRRLRGHASKVYWSRDSKKVNPLTPDWPSLPGVPDKPRIASLAGGTVTFADGSTLPFSDADTILLATGYEKRVPFLSAGGHLDTVSDKEDGNTRLTTNTRYIHPLFEHTLSLDPTYPLGALYFNGLVLSNPTGMTDCAQAIYAAHTIARPELLEDRETLLAKLGAREEKVRQAGYDPGWYGHKIGAGYGGELEPYEDQLVAYLRALGVKGGGVPPEGQNFTEGWRIVAGEHAKQITFAWEAGEKKEGKEAWNERWAKGRRTEEDYARAVDELVEWWEREKGGEGFRLEEVF